MSAVKPTDFKKVDKMRHSTAHILAAAVLELYPEAKFGIGPVIENGFYYDIDLPNPLTSLDLKKIEKRMKDIVRRKEEFVREEMSIEEAIKLFQKTKQNYKVELLKDLQKKGTTAINEDEAGVVESGAKTATIYKTGKFVDLCRGPHVETSNEIGAFKLKSVAGAYWRGKEGNPMLQRIYGLAFETKEELEEYLKLLEDAEKRDHRKLGKELDLFCFSDLVGAGLPLFSPNGVIIIDALRDHIETVCRRYGFEKVMTPHLAKIGLYEISGHAKKFSNELFHVTSEKGHDFVMKPVQCPHQTQIYASRPRSYRDLPIRYMESEKQYRAEKTGEVGGLSRVYAITVEDGHTFCRPDQVKDEMIRLVNIIKDFYSALGLWGKHWVSLSVRDYAHPEKYIGESEDWDLCESMLQEISDEMGLSAKRQEGEAALYGPKLDFMFRDSIGKEIQIPTVQIDFATPKRFSLVYADKDGKEKPPVMVHRAILGSYERFLALLIEHFAGAFPVWLSPIQVQVIPVSESHGEIAEKLSKELGKEGIRVKIDLDNESVGKKIRRAEKQKVPYMLVIGDKEKSLKNVNVRTRGKKDEEEMSLEAFKKKVGEQIEKRKVDL